MGFGLGTAIGISATHPDDLIISIDGDGSNQECLQDLITIREMGFNNGGYGFIDELRELGKVPRNHELGFFKFNPEWRSLSLAMKISI